MLKKAVAYDAARVRTDRLQIRCLPESYFQERLCHERKRAERSGETLVLMLLYRRESHSDMPVQHLLRAAAKALAESVRDTDIVGWCEEKAVLGILFTELKNSRAELVTKILQEKMVAALSVALGPSEFQRLQISFHSFPEEFKPQRGKKALQPVIYPDLFGLSEAKKVQLLIKRLIDVVGSSLALMIFSPLFLLLALAIKCTSDGPVLFRQERLGQYGVPFVFLKFRSMYVKNSSSIHEKFVKAFIAGGADSSVNPAAQRCFKITNDPRITPLGRFMRRTSLDELPQFWNVLRGEMSLVGPRPPIPYEIEVYETWHRRRIYEVKPGITGFWQVHGRSRTTFDEMVRLDLRYAREWTPAVDLKVLLKTPGAVFSGDGAF